MKILKICVTCGINAYMSKNTTRCNKCHNEYCRAKSKGIPVPVATFTNRQKEKKASHGIGCGLTKDDLPMAKYATMRLR